MPQGFKANPGLKLANAFSVKEDSLAMNRWAIFNRPLTRTRGMQLFVQSGLDALLQILSQVWIES